MSRRRPRAARLVVLGAVVAGLTFVALWRVATPRITPSTGAPEPSASFGRRITLDAAEIREVPSGRTLWVAGGDGLRFVVLDPDVKRTGEVVLEPGTRVTLVGLVRATPAVDVAVRQWGIDAATAVRVAERAEYVYATEIRTP
jgi:hypothetical protein